ncbi:MAG: phosphatase PAP2 family protein [Candidatus Nealsonbacteria bacterium]
MDYFIFQQINGLAGRSVCLDSLGIFFAEYLIYILGGAALLLFRKNLRRIIWAGLAVVLAKFGIAELIRLFWLRPRPFVENNVNLLVEVAAKPSFPSGHASVCFALSFVVYHYHKKAGIAFFAASFLISIARVFVGVHWPLDILGGAVVGILAGWIIIKISQKFKCA